MPLVIASMLWFTVLILFLALLVILPGAKEKTLKRLANIQDRDEREEQITGLASRATYISTLSLMIFLLFFSIFSVDVYKVPENKAVPGNTGTIAIGIHFNLIDSLKAPPANESTLTDQIFFESKDLPLSKSGIIVVLLVWQLLAFNIAARKAKQII